MNFLLLFKIHDSWAMEIDCLECVGRKAVIGFEGVGADEQHRMQ